MAPPRKHDTDRILDAARDLVLARGPRAASVAAIARASGAPVGSLYHRFGSRDGIVAAAWLRALERFQQGVLDTYAAAGEDPVEAGAAIARWAVRFAGRRPEDARLLLAVRRDDLLDGAPGAEVGARLREMNARVEAVLRDLAGRLGGRTGPRMLDGVMRAVVDVPHAALRRHVQEDRPVPGWLEEDVAAASRALLAALLERRP